MASLAEIVPRLKRALSDARAPDLARIDEGLLRFGVTGVHGEPEVGTTSVIETAITRSAQMSVRVDLDGASSDDDIAWQIARGVARLSFDWRTLSALVAAPDLAPTSARRELVRFREDVGARFAELALGDEPTGEVSVAETLDVLGRLWRDAVAPILWIDHLQAPALTSRHPVDVDALLWNVRSLHQRTELAIVLSGNKAVSEIAYGERRAFYRDGVWVTLDRPRRPVWLEVAAALGDQAPSPAWISEMTEITACHPQTMLLALALRSELPEHAQTPLGLWQLMLSLDDGHVGRAMQHARSLHRLGGFVLNRIAHGVGPYEGARTKPEKNERGRAAGRLYEGGLITRVRPRAWGVTNPLLGGRLRRELPLTAADAYALETAEPAME